MVLPDFLSLLNSRQKTDQQKIYFFQEYRREMRLRLLKSTCHGDLSGIFTFHFDPQEYLENCSSKVEKVKNRKNGKNMHFSYNSGTPGAIVVNFVTFIVINRVNFAK